MATQLQRYHVIQTAALDLVFMSYDEANADANFGDLVSKAPWAKRSHGVRGIDAAHKAAARMSSTNWFILVDGDTRMDKEFLDLEFKIPEERYECSFSWNSWNVVNGCCYGNGGLKMWNKEFVLNKMKTHEASPTDKYGVDFCWYPEYNQLQNCYSTTQPNGSAFQAWRAGFREGVKMCLVGGQRVPAPDVYKSVWPGNFKRLMQWCTLGSDAEFGYYAIYGTLRGMMMYADPKFDISLVSDYDFMQSIYRPEAICQDRVGAAAREVGSMFNLESHGLPVIEPLLMDASRHVKAHWFSKPKNIHNAMDRE